MSAGNVMDTLEEQVVPNDPVDAFRLSEEDLEYVMGMGAQKWFDGDYRSNTTDIVIIVFMGGDHHQNKYPR